MDLEGLVDYFQTENPEIDGRKKHNKEKRRKHSEKRKSEVIDEGQERPTKKSRSNENENCSVADSDSDVVFLEHFRSKSRPEEDKFNRRHDDINCKRKRILEKCRKPKSKKRRTADSNDDIIGSEYLNENSNSKSENKTSIEPKSHKTIRSNFVSSQLLSQNNNIEHLSPKKTSKSLSDQVHINDDKKVHLPKNVKPKSVSKHSPNVDDHSQSTVKLTHKKIDNIGNKVVNHPQKKNVDVSGDQSLIDDRTCNNKEKKTRER
jgi:hypothetical protein